MRPLSLPKLELYIQMIRSKLANLGFDMKRLALDMLNIKVWVDGLSVGNKRDYTYRRCRCCNQSILMICSGAKVFLTICTPFLIPRLTLYLD